MPKTFNPETEIPDLSGKVILVTGGNSGLGLSTILALAAHSPACIYLCARRRNSAEEALALVHNKHPQANIQILDLDVASFESVRSCAAAFTKQSDRLDMLFLNAGASCIAPGLTKEGYEASFGTNHMGHSLLTQLLLPTMLKTAEQPNGTDVRIIFVASAAAYQFYKKKTLSMDRMKDEWRDMKPLGRYGHSKLANILMAKKLAQLYPSITSVSLHPGFVSTNVINNVTKDSDLSYIVTQLGKYFLRAFGTSSDEGAKTQLWAATGKKGKDGVENGEFYTPIGKKFQDDKLDDEKSMDELWSWIDRELNDHGAPGWPST